MTNKKVILYGTEWCAYCQQLKNWLNNRNVEFSYRDVEQIENSKDFKKYKAKAIPYLVIKNEDSSIENFVQGFNPLETEKILE